MKTHPHALPGCILTLASAFLLFYAFMFSTLAAGAFGPDEPGAWAAQLEAMLGPGNDRATILFIVALGLGVYLCALGPGDRIRPLRVLACATAASVCLWLLVGLVRRWTWLPVIEAHTAAPEAHEPPGAPR